MIAILANWITNLLKKMYFLFVFSKNSLFKLLLTVFKRRKTDKIK